ncbi:MAG: hypothetical protein IJ086_11460 [Clostridium sp.]|nr:hypothetical protein [Clostridium sp.]
MSNKKNAGRKKNELTEEIKQEAKEILDLAFKDVGCVKSKVSYNNVSKFNNHIANNPDYVRANGELFNDFGVRFWSKTYNDEPYYGKLLIDELKSVKDIVAGGEVFEINNKDIESLVDRYHNKPEELKKRLVNLFSKDRKEILSLKTRNSNLTNNLQLKDKALKQFKEGFATVFWNSTSTYNSLDDVLSLEKPEDGKMNDELLNMFGNQEELKNLLNVETVRNNVNAKTIVKDSTEEKESSSDKNVLSIEDRLKRLGLSTSQDDGL